MRRLNESDYERLNLEADRIEQIRDYVPEEEFDETTAQGIAHQEIAPYCDNGK
jgi:hypothetical protein